METNFVQYKSDTETTLRDIINVIFRYKLVVILFSLIIMIIVYIKQEMVTPAYTADVKMLITGIKEAEAAYYRDMPVGGQMLVSTLIELVNSKVVLKRVVDALELYKRDYDADEMRQSSKLKRYLIKKRMEKRKSTLQTMSDEQKKEEAFNIAMGKLIGNISASAIEQSSMFIITVRDFNPSAAVAIANSISRSFIMFDLEQKVAELELKYGDKHATVIQLQNYITSLYKTLDGRPLPDIEAIGPASVKIVGQAQISGVTDDINKKTGLILSVLIGLFGGIALAFVLDYFDQTIKLGNDIEKHLGIPFLGSIDKHKSKLKQPALNFNINNNIKYYRNITNNLSLAMKKKNINSILIADAERSEDAVSVIVNIAYDFVRQNKKHRILIIDADLRSSSMSRVLNINSTPGLADVIEGKVSLESAIQDLGSNINILSAGLHEGNIETLLNSAAVSDIVRRAKTIYQIVLISCSDVKTSTDSVDLSSTADAFVLVVNSGKIKRIIAKRLIFPFIHKNVQILGAILNNRKMVIPDILYKRI